MPLSHEWGKALREYMQKGGTLVVCADQFTGAGRLELDLPESVGEKTAVKNIPLKNETNRGETEKEADAFRWNLTDETIPANVFRCHSSGKVNPDRRPDTERVLATAPDGTPIATAYRRGQGQLIYVGIPLGLGIDMRPVPLSGLLLGIWRRICCRSKWSVTWSGHSIEWMMATGWSACSTIAAYSNPNTAFCPQIIASMSR